MVATDVADTIREAVAEEIEEERHAAEDFRRRAAIVIAVLAMLLAIASLGGGNATKETINANILASDTWAFFQAKNIRQTDNQLATDELESLLLTQRDLSPEARAQIQQRIDRDKATVARYESEPATGEGKKELTARAQAYEARRDRAQRQDPNFDYAQALFQIAIVLGSVSIVAVSRPLLGFSIVLGALATLLTLNGFFLLANLSIG